MKHLVLISCLAISITVVDFAEGETDFPPILDADDIAYFSEDYDVEGLHWALSNVFQRSLRNKVSGEIAHSELPYSIVSRGGGLTYSTAYKLKMDLEQAEYLAEALEDNEAAYFRNQVIPIYKQVLSNIPALDKLERTSGLYGFRKGDYDAGIAQIYNKALYHTNFDHLRDEQGEILPLLSDTFDARAIETQWFSKDVGIAVVDNILSPLALKRIQQLLLESTVWYQTKMPLKFGGYVGAYIDDGLYDRILLQLAFDLHKALPNIMEGHPLKYLWAYKYDSEYTGINLHADQAAVNVNLWLTRDEANQDEDSGGLVIFTAKPPDDWDFAKFNTDTERVRKEILEPTNFHNITVPYRENRAVMFDSALFHHTDTYKFKEGYQNRRINLTILYGDMQLNKDVSQKREANRDSTRDDL